MPPQLRTFLVLGRVSNLPTIWSNCLAGWWLAGGGHAAILPLLFLGVSALYTGGSCLNDAFDTEFDRQRRPGRPIPSGKISSELVWRLGFSQLALGIFLLCFCGKIAAVAAVLLAFTIWLYDFTHKFLIASPWLMGACRFWVYFIAGTTGARGLNGWPIYCGVAVALFATGVSQIARRERFRGPVSLRPLFPLLAPVALALAMNSAACRGAAVWISLIFLLWLGFSVRTLFATDAANGRRLVENLLAGIVLVDWLAVAPQGPRWLTVLLLTLFGATLLGQRFIPKT